MGSTRPAAKADDLEGNSSIQAFLACAINHALSTAAYLVEQLVVAKVHLDARIIRRLVVSSSARAKACPKQTNTAKAEGRIRKNRSSAFFANSGCVCHAGPLSIFRLDLYCPKFLHWLR